MKNMLLLPRVCRVIGFVLLPLAITLFVANANYNFKFAFLDTPKPFEQGSLDFRNCNLTDEFAISGILVSLLMIAFSRLKHEDEYLKSIRLQSLQVGVYANYVIFLVLTFTVYGTAYLSVLMYNVLTILILFILVFNFNLYIRPLFSKTRIA